MNAIKTSEFVLQCQINVKMRLNCEWLGTWHTALCYRNSGRKWGQTRDTSQSPHLEF